MNGNSRYIVYIVWRFGGNVYYMFCNKVVKITIRVKWKTCKSIPSFTKILYINIMEHAIDPFL